MELKLDIHHLMKVAHETAYKKGWWGEDGIDSRLFPEKIALMHSELSEVLEEFRMHGVLEKHIYFTENENKPEGIAVEFADLLIRVADTCEAYGIPLVRALWMKLDYNRSRPHRHGGKKC